MCTQSACKLYNLVKRFRWVKLSWKGYRGREWEKEEEIAGKKGSEESLCYPQNSSTKNALLFFSTFLKNLYTVIDRLFKVTMSVKLQKERRKALKKHLQIMSVWSVPSFSGIGNSLSLFTDIIIPSPKFVFKFRI